MAADEMPLTMVSEQVEEQVHSIQRISSANPVNSVGEEIVYCEGNGRKKRRVRRRRREGRVEWQGKEEGRGRKQQQQRE